MNKFEKYFSNRKHFIKEDLKNTYVVYETSSSRHCLLSDSYSIVMVNDVPDTFKENKKYSSSIISMFERFIDKNDIKKVDTYYIYCIGGYSQAPVVQKRRILRKFAIVTM